VLATIVSFGLVFFFVRTRIPELEEDEDEPEPGALAQKDEPKAPPAAAPEKKSSWQVMKEVTSEKTFWIFITFIFLLVLVKMIFQYNHSLYPIYMERVGMAEWTGRLYSINPLIIIFLVPVVTAITSRMDGYKVIVVGTFVSAASVFVLGFGEAIALVIVFQIVLSFGEALYSPRLYDYTASIAPPGKEASYMAYSKAPMFFAKVAAGPATGFLLAGLCPEEGARNTELMWIIVGVSTMISPIALVLGRRWLDVEARKRREEQDAA
jgi:MFS family permease